MTGFADSFADDPFGPAFGAEERDWRTESGMRPSPWNSGMGPAVRGDGERAFSDQGGVKGSGRDRR